MKLINSLFTVGFYTLLSRITGYVRDIFIARYLGAGSAADAFLVAFKLPNFFRTIFAEGALSSAFVPIFSGKITKDRKLAIYFASNVISVLFIMLIIITIIFEIYMPVVMSGLATGFKTSPDKFNLAVLYARITFPYLVFISLTSVYTGILNSIGRFSAAAAVPILLNISMTIAVCYFSDFFGSAAIALSVGVFVSGILQLLTIIYASYTAKVVLVLKLPEIDVDLKKMLKNMIPGVIGSGITQINLWVGTIIATTVVGAASTLYYAERLNQFPLAIIGIALGTILLPELSKQIKEGKAQEATITQNTAMLISLFLTLPCAAALVLIGHPMIETLLERGAFSRQDSVNASSALSLLAMGLPAFVMLKIFTPRFFANLDTKTPVYISFVSVIVNIALSIVLMKDYSFNGIAFASAFSGWVSAILLGVFLFKDHKFYFVDDFYPKLLKIITSTIIMSIVLYLHREYLYQKLAHMLHSRLISLMVMIGVSSTVYLSFSLYFKIVDMKYFIRKKSR